MCFHSLAASCLFVSVTLLGSACAPLPASEPPATTLSSSAAAPPEQGSRSTPQPLGIASVTLAPPPAPAPRQAAPPATSPIQPATTAAKPAPDEVEYEEHGDLSRGQRAVLHVVATCYLRSLERREESTGELFVELSLDPTGKVLGVTMADGFSSGVRACAEPRLGEVQFAPGDGRLGLLRIPIQQLTAEEVDPSN